LPWIADFRDPWLEEGVHPRPGSFRYRVEAALERAVVERANRIILTTPLLREEFLSRYSGLDVKKARVIYNGYDESDFQGIDEIPQGERFELIHAGLITPDFRNPFPFLETIANLTRNGYLPKEEVKVTFLGGGDYVHSPDFVEKVRRAGLSGIVEVISRVPHRESLERMRRAAVLLLFQASEDTRSLIPAKAFEYLRIGNPILALTLKGATSELIQETGEGEAVDPNDHSMLERAVTSLYKMWRKGAGGGLPVRPSILRYERSILTQELALILDEMVASPK
jgi:glycosyltransferase involved in cell wall biosynthesis